MWEYILFVWIKCCFVLALINYTSSLKCIWITKKKRCLWLIFFLLFTFLCSTYCRTTRKEMCFSITYIYTDQSHIIAIISYAAILLQHNLHLYGLKLYFAAYTLMQPLIDFYSNKKNRANIKHPFMKNKNLFKFTTLIPFLFLQQNDNIQWNIIFQFLCVNKIISK